MRDEVAACGDVATEKWEVPEGGGGGKKIKLVSEEILKIANRKETIFKNVSDRRSQKNVTAHFSMDTQILIALHHTRTLGS